jgi:hypothetical protein
MGQQSNKIIKRRRRVDYLKRKKEQEKLGGLLPKAKVKTLTPKTDADAEDASAAKKVAAKKAPAKKAVAKKAPAKKVAKETPAAEESSEA